MKLLKRNLTEFEYRAYLGKQEVMDNGRHTGRYEVTYGDPVCYEGNIGLPNGYVQTQFFGINNDYTHVLIMDDVNVDIKEAGLIEWRGSTYRIQAVRQSLNVVSVAIKKLTDSERGAIG